jgi:hypothetical protein
VDPGVLGQIRTVGKGLATAGALVGLWFSKMYLGVELQVSFAGKCLKKQGEHEISCNGSRQSFAGSAGWGTHCLQ